MQSPIVHVGYHKTATTWMQKRLFPLLESHEFLHGKMVENTFLHPPGLHFCPQAAARELRLGSRNRPVLVSEENLTGYPHNGGLNGLVAPEAARRIKAVLPDAHILMFVRNQFDICRSSYDQYVSVGGTWKPERYFNNAPFVRGPLREPWKAPVFVYEQFEFDRLVAFYDGLFGRERVHVYPYEWWRDRETMIARLESRLGLRFASLPEAGGEANASLTPARQSILRVANAFTRHALVNKSCVMNLPFGRQMRWAVGATLRSVPHFGSSVRKRRLPDTIRDSIASVYRESNARLCALRDLPLEELGYPM